ncbi:MAG: helix-turn-helix transcriptional regulator [Myxococcales bacterium]|nr:helix-turn-helix transcriptional regulator [Myxococcales bacterium]
MGTTDSHWRRAHHRVERAARELTSADALTEQVGAVLADAVDADAHVFLRLDPLTALWLGASGAGYDPAACQHFTANVFLKSPLADYAASARDDVTVVRVPRGGIPAEDPYARYYFGDLGYEEDLHATFAAGGQSFGHLTLARRSGAFAAGAVRLVERAVPIVTQALRRLLAKETLESVPGDGVGLLFVDAGGGVAAANALGDELLARSVAADPHRTRDALSALVEIARRELVRATGAPMPRVVYVERGTHQRYRLVAERMRSRPDDPPQILIMAEPIRALDSVELLRTAGLSEREAEVSLLLLRGFKSVEGAASLGMSEHTFLAHVKAVYRKLGVGSRGELAALLLAGV